MWSEPGTLPGPARRWQSRSSETTSSCESHLCFSFKCFHIFYQKARKKILNVWLIWQFPSKPDVYVQYGKCLFQAKDGAERVGVPQEAKWCRSWWQIPLPTSLQALLPQAASLSCIWASQVTFQATRVSTTALIIALLWLVHDESTENLSHFHRQHEFARGAEEVRQRRRPPHQSRSLLQPAALLGPEAAQTVQHPARRHQARQHPGRSWAPGLITPAEKNPKTSVWIQLMPLLFHCRSTSPRPSWSSAILAPPRMLLTMTSLLIWSAGSTELQKSVSCTTCCNCQSRLRHVS